MPTTCVTDTRYVSLLRRDGMFVTGACRCRKRSSLYKRVPSPAVSEANDDPPEIQIGAATATWFISWGIGWAVVVPIVVAALGASLADDLTIVELSVSTAAAWIVLMLGLAVASRKFGSGAPISDFRLGFRPIDLVGVPIGAATQLVLVPLVYVPLRGLWPDAFSNEQIEERAQDLVDRAGGANAVLLVLVVVVGAPIVEELVYRGLLQRSLTSAVGAAGGLTFAAAWFSLIHFSPVLYPGLFVAGVIFGGGLLLTGRIGMGIVTHASFNAAGLIFAYR